MPEALRILFTFLVGVGSGLLSGAFGVGGAVVSTPGIRAVGATPFEAVGSTIPATLPSAISGALRYHREGLIRWRVVRWTSLTGVVAVVGGSLLSHVVPGDGHALMLATALLVLVTAYRTARPPVQVPAPIGELSTEPRPHEEVTLAHAEAHLAAGLPAEGPWWPMAAVGIIAGTLSGLLGIGGGILMVPSFAFIGLRIKEAIASSLVCVGIFAIPGTITHAFQGDINWIYALPLCAGVIPGARIGSAFAIRATEQSLRRIVAIGLTIVAVAYGTSEVLALF